MLAGLPLPARRFFEFTIKPGAQLHLAVQLWFEGQVTLGYTEPPRYQSVYGRQIICCPHGFIWKIFMGQGLSYIAGSASLMKNKSRLNYRLFDIIPVAVHCGGEDYVRWSFARMVAEAILWSPAALLPRQGVKWEAIGNDIARVTVSSENLHQAVDITIAESGQPTKVVFQRCGGTNRKKKFQQQTFGGYLSNYEMFEGYQLPTHVEAGNNFDTPDYFPLYIIELVGLRYIPPIMPLNK